MKSDKIKNGYALEYAEIIVAENREKYENGVEYEFDVDGKKIWFKQLIVPLYKRDRLVGRVLVNIDVTDKKKLEKLSITDEITSLYNRRYFNEILDREINRQMRNKGFLSFLMLDIDYFKQYNDSYGHEAGDKALSLVADAIKGSLHRSSDYAFRLGGEEFGVIFSNYNKDESLAFTQKIKKSIDDLDIPHIGSLASEHITVSAGLIVVDFSKEKIDKNGFYTMADDALYEAKKEGRDRIVLYESDVLEFF